MCPKPALLPKAEPGLGSGPGGLYGALRASAWEQTCHLAGMAFVLGDSRPEAVTDAISRVREEVPVGDLSCRQSQPRLASKGGWLERVLFHFVTSVPLKLKLYWNHTKGHYNM